MALKTIITDGTGTDNKLKVTDEGTIGVVIHNHPPDKNDTFLIPFASDFVNSAGSADLRVNGATTPQVFSVSSQTNGDVFISSISIYIADAGARLNLFGALAALTNGVDFIYFNDSVGEITVKGGMQTNLDLIRLGQQTGAVGDGTTAYRLDVSGGGADAYLPLIDLRAVFGLQWGLKLQKERNDRISFVINDDLSAGLDVFNIRAFGIRT